MKMECLRAEPVCNCNHLLIPLPNNKVAIADNAVRSNLLWIEKKKRAHNIKKCMKMNYKTRKT